MPIGELNAEDLLGLVGRELEGRYLLDQYIDRGGFGAVYRGIDKKFNQPVAIKVGLSYREFMKEAKLAAEVRHDHIVQVTDYGHDNGLAYLVMEFLQGENLEVLFTSQGHQLTPEQLRKFVREVGGALTHAHDDRLIHRDLKPRNVILKRSSTKSGTSVATGKFVLLDFGIAAKLDATGTQRNLTNNGAGTVEYMAPELLSSNPQATPQADIYAFGIILYQMLVGRVPFPQKDNSHMALAVCLHAISHEPPPRFSEVAAERPIPAAIEALVRQCLEKDPARRPQSMAEVVERFRAGYPPPSRVRNTSGGLGDFEDDDEDDSSWSASGIGRSDGESGIHWSWIVTVLLCASLLGFAGWQHLNSEAAPLPVPTLTLTGGNQERLLADGDPLTITAGESVSVTFAILDLPRGVIPQFTDPEVPSGLTIQQTSGSSSKADRTFEVSIADPNHSPTESPRIVFQATLPGRKSPLETAVRLDVVRPKPWLPTALSAANFLIPSDARLCRVQGELFASALDCRLAGDVVRFRLIPGTEVDQRRIATFYAMEHLVTNKQFQAFAKENPNFELEPRPPGERTWETNDETPVTNVYVLEAQRFAQWIGWKHGTLPTATEWEVAAGYYEFTRALEKLSGQPTNTGTPQMLQQLSKANHILPELNFEVALGQGPAMNEVYVPEEGILKECSPFGCRFDRLSSGVRATEMTGTLEDFTNAGAELSDLCWWGIPDVDDKTVEGNLFHARLRGLGDGAKDNREMEWVRPDGPAFQVLRPDDFNAIGTLTLLPADGIARSSHVGFRVILRTDLARE